MNAAHLHLLINHVPVIGIPIVLALLAYAVARDREELLRASMVGLAMLGIATLGVYLTGEPAEEVLTELARVSEAAIEEHEEAALVAAVIACGAGLLALFGLVRFRARPVPVAFRSALLVAALLASGALAVTAYLGGPIRHPEVRDGAAEGEVGAKPGAVIQSIPGSASSNRGVAPVANPPEEKTMTIEIPHSLRVEHAEIHEALVDATRKSGPVGEAARELARVLDPHFVREEEVALPPLGLLGRLVQEGYEPWMDEVLPMTDALKAELSGMLGEHEVIGRAARALETAAHEAGDAEIETLAKKLQMHAQSEEEVFYPAAVLVGEVVKARRR